MENLERLKVLLGPDLRGLTEQAVGIYLEEAEAYFLDTTNRIETPATAKGLIIDLALFNINKRGSEAEASRSEGGISVNYFENLPTNLLGRLKKYRLLGVVKCK